MRIGRISVFIFLMIVDSIIMGVVFIISVFLRMRLIVHLIRFRIMFMFRSIIIRSMCRVLIVFF